MKILALERELDTSGHHDYHPHLKAEALALWELVKSNIVREAYFARESHTAVLVLECNSIVEAQDHLGHLPLVKAGFIDFDCLILDPYTGYERLFPAEETA